jgi:hypothetical protein
LFFHSDVLPSFPPLSVAMRNDMIALNHPHKIVVDICLRFHVSNTILAIRILFVTIERHAFKAFETGLHFTASTRPQTRATELLITKRTTQSTIVAEINILSASDTLGFDAAGERTSGAAGVDFGGMVCSRGTHISISLHVFME